eukprot:1780855-Amphidinium_carterae.1
MPEFGGWILASRKYGLWPPCRVHNCCGCEGLLFKIAQGSDVSNILMALSEPTLRSGAPERYSTNTEHYIEALLHSLAGTRQNFEVAN